MAKTTKEELYRGFLNLLRSDTFGWDDELRDGDGALEDLLEKGTLLGKNGERIPGKGGRSESDRRKVIAAALGDGKAVYIYRKGEEYPREVHYDEEKGKFTVSEPVNQLKLEEVPKPHWFKRIYLNLFSLMFRGKSLQSVRDWKHYEHRKEAFDNAMAQKRVDRRRRFDPILQGKTEAEEKKTKSVSLSGEAEETMAAQPESEPAEKKQPSQEEKKTEPEKLPEQPGVSELKELIETLNQQYQELREELKAQKELNAEMKKALDAQSVKKERETPAPPMLDGKEAVGREEVKKDFFRESEKPEATEPKKDLDAVEKEPVPEQKTEQPAAEAKQNEKKPKTKESQIRTSAKPVVSRINSKYVSAVKKGADPLSQIKKAEDAKRLDFTEMMERLRKQEKGKLPQRVEENIRTLYENSEKAKRELEKSCAEKKLFAGGDAVRQIVAFNSIKKQIENGGLSGTSREMLGATNGAKLVTDMTGLTDEVKYAANNAHAPSYFRKLFLDQNKLDEITDSSDKKAHGFVAEHFSDEKQLHQALSQPQKSQQNKTAKVQQVKTTPKVERPNVPGA